MTEKASPTIEIYADTRGERQCRSCDQRIVFAQIVKGGKVMPFDAPLVALRTRHDADRRLIEEVDLGESHFATCPKANQFRRR